MVGASSSHAEPEHHRHEEDEKSETDDDPGHAIREDRHATRRPGRTALDATEPHRNATDDGSDGEQPGQEPGPARVAGSDRMPTTAGLGTCASAAKHTLPMTAATNPRNSIDVATCHRARG